MQVEIESKACNHLITSYSPELDSGASNTGPFVLRHPSVLGWNRFHDLLPSGLVRPCMKCLIKMQSMHLEVATMPEGDKVGHRKHVHAGGAQG